MAFHSARATGAASVATRAFFLTGTALGVSILIAAAAPGQAWAADECGADVAGAVICTATSGTANPYPTGIDYTGDAGEDITVTLTGGGALTAVNVVTATDSGVTVVGTAGFDATLYGEVGSTIDAAIHGIVVNATNGDALVFSATDVTADYYGIVAGSSGGDATVVNGGAIYSGDIGGSFVSGGISVSANGGNAGVLNLGAITVDTSSFTATGIAAYSFAGQVTFINGADIDVYNNGAYAFGLVATGQNLGATIDSTGDVSVSSSANATGVFAFSLVDAGVTLVGDLDVTANGDLYGISINAAGYAAVDVTGDIYTNQNDYAYNNTGITAAGYTGVNISVEGDVLVGDGTVAAGIVASATGLGADVTIDVTGDIQVGDGIGTLDTYTGFGVVAQSTNGSVIFTQTGDLGVYSYNNATGITIQAYDVASVSITGDVDVYSYIDNGVGLVAQGGTAASLTVDGDVYVYGFDNATGAVANGAFDSYIDITGNLDVIAQNGNGLGAQSYSFFGDSAVTVGAGVDVDANGDATGVLAQSVFGDASIDVTGDSDIFAATGSGNGLSAASANYDATVTTNGSVTVYGGINANGIVANAYGAATIDATGDIYVTAVGADAYAAVATAYNGDASVTVVGDIDVYAYDFGEGVRAISANADAIVDVTGDVTVDTYDGDAAAIDARGGADVSVTVVGALDTYSEYNDAWGVFAAATLTTDVDLTGDVTAESANYNAYGVQALSVTGTTVSVTGDLDIDAYNYAIGVYASATGGAASVTLVGDTDVYAVVDAIGVSAQSSGDATIDVTGNVDVFAFAGVGYGLIADSTTGQAMVTVTGGDLYVYGDDIAQGIVAHGVTGASVDVTGGVEVYAFFGPATGVDAQSTTGSTAVDVTGYVEIDAYGNAQGVYAFGLNGSSVTITGNLAVESDTGQGAGIFSQTVNNDANAVLVGNAYIYGETAGVGLTAISTNGDSYVGAEGDLHVTGYNSVGQGLVSSAGDVATIYLNGSLDVYGYNNALGMTANGNSAVVTIIGDVDVYSYIDDGTGINLSATTTANLDMTGDLYVYGFNYATGVAVTANSAIVSLTGDVEVIAELDDAFGIDVNTVANAAVSFTGDMTVDALDYVYGISAISTTGGLDVDIAGTVDVYSVNNFATGVNLYAELDIDLDATGTITAQSATDGTWGVFATSYDGYVDLSVENVTVTSIAGGAGIQTYGYDGVNVVSSGLISTVGDNVEGVTAYSPFGNVTVAVNDVSTNGFSSEGVDANSFAGEVYVIGNGDVVTLGDFSDALQAYSIFGDVYTTSNGTTSTAGFASNGLDAFSIYGNASAYNFGDSTTTGDSSDAVVAGSIFADAFASNSAEVNTAGLNSYGVSSFSQYGDATTLNSGSVFTTGDYGIGLNAYAVNGIATVDNSAGHVETTGDYATGIYAYGYAGVNISNGSNTTITSGYSAVGIFGFSADAYVLINSGHVETSGDFSYGILGVSLGSDSFDYVTINSDLVNTTGNNADGIVAYTYYGDITIDSGTVHTSGDSSYGINAYAYNYGDVDITSDLVTTNGVGSIGIYGYAFLGTTTVDSGTVRTFDDQSIGIYAYGFTGADVTSDYVRTYGDFSTGIAAVANLGTATVDSVNLTTQGDYSTGIVAIGHDGVEIDSIFLTTFGDHSDGVVGANYGGGLVDIYSHDSYTNGDYSDGIVAVSAGYYDSFAGVTTAGSVLINSDFVRTDGYNSYGIVATAGGGDVDVYSYSVRTYGDASVGIYAAAFNYYDSTPGFEQNLQGDVYVDSNFVRTSGDFSTGIDTYAEGGNIRVVANTVLTYGDFSDGIDAYAAYYGPDPVLLTYYSGDVYIEAYDVRTYGDFSDGINAYAGGGRVDVYATGVFVTGLGSDAIYAGTGGLDASNSDDVFVGTYGYIYSGDGVGVHIDSAGASNVFVDGDSSVYGYDWAVQSYSVDGTRIDNDGSIFGGAGRAIDVNGGAAYIDNDGYVFGFVNLTDNADHFENDRTWVAYGTSSFGLGSDDVDNDGFLSFSRYTGAAASTTFTGLEFFDNAGVITGVDNQVNDQLVMTGTSFTGVAGVSELDLDVQLGGPGSAADRLFIGSAQGVTEIVLNDLLAGSPGALNFGGILVVDSANAAEVGNEFTMDSVDKGFVEYSLFFDAPNDNWLIVGLPDDEAFELLGAMSTGQDFWRRSGDAVFARWQEVRDSTDSAGASAGPGGAGRSDGWELWMQAAVGGEKIDNLESYTIGGFGFTADLSEKSDFRGFQFGFDNLQGNTLFGATMGFNQQEMTFNVDGNSFDTEGWNIGAYAGWASNGFFINGLVKGDFYTVDGNFHTIPTLFSFDGTTWGAEGELGYRWGGDGFFLEPIAALSWTTTSLDSVTTSGMTVDFDDSESLRGKAGARIGGMMGSGDVIVTPYLGAYWVDEFQGDNALTFTTGPTSIDFADTGLGSHGLVDFGFTAQTLYGLEGFVKGEWNFGGDVEGGTARIGVRWRW